MNCSHAERIPSPRFSLELVPRQCRLQEYRPLEMPSFQLDGEFIAYASPESTYAVTRRLMDGATRSILIGIYDFTAAHVRDTLIAAMRRGVRVSLMLDLDGRKGESEVWEKLLRAGVEGVPAPSCASDHARYFPSCHEKVIVIDDTWTLVQSGNYSDASIPRNEKDGGDPDDPHSFVPGNRDMGIAIRSEPLAAFFTQVLRSDMQLELDAAAIELLQEERAAPVEGLLEAARPPRQPPALFPSRLFRPRRPVEVVPVLSPDNYMEVIPDFLASASHSIYIEQQYIRGHQPEIGRLLAAIRAARERNRRLNVRIVLAQPYSSDVDQERRSLEKLEEFGLRLGNQIRFLNPRYFVHCHNKLIIVDQRAVLVSSQNWSDFAVSKNREAGLLIRYSPLARYYASIFRVDWETGLRTLPGPEELPFLAGREAMAAGDVLPVSLGDYVEV
jgi:phosphatidylserine/phosphatidylglycerophosphate/cardiolipin synthase-like enzyme